jgi:hypothetical protein
LLRPRHHGRAAAPSPTMNSRRRILDPRAYQGA